MTSILNAAQAAQESLKKSSDGATSTAAALAEMHQELEALASRQREREAEVERIMVEADNDERQTMQKVAEMNVAIFGGGK